MIRGIDDLAHLPGSLCAQVAPAHAASALCASPMSGTEAVALSCRPVHAGRPVADWARIPPLALCLLNAMPHYR